MPFTLSHPAAVIPLRKWGVFSALVVGSMMPDTIYFLPIAEQYRGYGHSWPGLFLYCLPAGFLLLLIFHTLLKEPLISLFPKKQQARLHAASEGFKFLPLRRFLTILVSLLVGAFTHIAWDSFTHTNTYAYNHFLWFREAIPLGYGATMSMAEMLQLGCSVFGIAVILFYYWRWATSEKTAENSRRLYLPKLARTLFFILLAAGAVVPLVVRFMLDPDFWIHAHRRKLIGLAAVDGIKLVSLEIFIFCVIWNLVFMARGNHPQSPLSHSPER